MVREVRVTYKLHLVASFIACRGGRIRIVRGSVPSSGGIECSELISCFAIILCIQNKRQESKGRGKNKSRERTTESEGRVIIQK